MSPNHVLLCTQLFVSLFALSLGIASSRCVSLSASYTEVPSKLVTWTNLVTGKVTLETRDLAEPVTVLS